MASGEFSRGKESIRAEGGIVMVGNFDVDIEQLLYQRCVAHLRWQAEQPGRDLRVEDGGGHATGGLEYDFDVLAAGMQNPWCAQQHVPERVHASIAQRVDAVDVLARGNLHEAKLGEVGLLAHELRVDPGVIAASE